MLEMIMVVIVLYIAFSVFFPGFSYKSGWNEALLLQTSRDVILTADRTNKLYNLSFDKGALQNFLSDVVSEENLISWSDTGGTVKNQIIIACNCTNDQLNYLNSWLSELEINGRHIDVPPPCYTNLESINPCIVSADVLLIWGEKTFPVPFTAIPFKNI